MNFEELNCEENEQYEILYGKDTPSTASLLSNARMKKVAELSPFKPRDSPCVEGAEVHQSFKCDDRKWDEESKGSYGICMKCQCVWPLQTMHASVNCDHLVCHGCL